MPEIRTVTTLRRKRDEIEAAIGNYEKRIKQARADLLHINAAIAIFEASGDVSGMAPYVDLHRLFKYGELSALCKSALALGPKDTREIAAYILRTKGLDDGDKVLIRSIVSRIIHTLRKHEQRGKITGVGRYKAARVWCLSS